MASAPLTSPSVSRPRSVTIVAVGVFLLGLLNIYRAIIIFQHIDLQLGLGVSLDPRIRMILAVIWSITLMVMAVVLWLRKPGARIAVPLLLLIYAIYRLALVGLFSESTYVRESQIVSIIVFGTAIAFASWALNQKGSRSYFTREDKGKRNDSAASLSDSSNE